MHYINTDTEELFDELSISRADSVYICHTYDIDGSNIDEVSVFATRNGARSHYRQVLKDTLIWSLCNDDYSSIDDAYRHLDSLTDEQLYNIWNCTGDTDRKLCFREYLVKS